MHNNMITIDGQKMGKSLGNFITLSEFFTGNHEKLEKAYKPLTIRFFILQAHYRSTLDFSNEALQAAEKGMDKLLTAIDTLDKLKVSGNSTVDVKNLQEKCFASMDDDFNSPVLIAHLFEGVKMINSINDGNAEINAEDLSLLKDIYRSFALDVLGLKSDDVSSATGDDISSDLIEMLLKLRQEAKLNKNWALADQIRNQLTEMGVLIKDTKEGYSWELR
jgi:cysteinyl-tRNA synthetase